MPEYFRAAETSGSHLVPPPSQSRTNFNIGPGCSVIAVKFRLSLRTNIAQPPQAAHSNI